MLEVAVCLAAGSEVAANLATKVRPRYHISGGRDTFYARPPYLNKDLGAGAWLWIPLSALLARHITIMMVNMYNSCALCIHMYHMWTCPGPAHIACTVSAPSGHLFRGYPVFLAPSM